MGLYMGVYNRGGFDMLVMQCLRVGYASLYGIFRKIRKSPESSENLGNASKPFFLKLIQFLNICGRDLNCPETFAIVEKFWTGFETPHFCCAQVMTGNERGILPVAYSRIYNGNPTQMPDNNNNNSNNINNDNNNSNFIIKG